MGARMRVMFNVAAWVLTVCAAVIEFQPATAQEAQADPYLLEPGDTIQVSVLEDPVLDRQVLILPDGQISLPAIGPLRAAGLSPASLEQVIRSALMANFVEPPTVTVSVITLADEDDEETNEVFVLGEVGTPGRFEYEEDKPITVLKALSLAGGLGPFAARQRIQVRELVEGTEVLRIFDYDAVEDGLINTDRDLATLADGAVIVVPERGLFE